MQLVTTVTEHAPACHQHKTGRRAVNENLCSHPGSRLRQDGSFSHRDALRLSACLMRQDAVDLEADNFDDIDDEKLMARALGNSWFTLARFRS